MKNNENVLFIISSAIHITSNPLNYTPLRSSFNADERAKQTVKTIESIREKVPGAKILFVELGSERNLPYGIADMVDLYLYLGNLSHIRDAADGPFKGLGEATGLYLASQWIPSFNADYYFKLSGRYYLNEEFDLNHWGGDFYTGKDFGGGIYTVFYGFPNRLFENWRDSLVNSYPVLRQGQALEMIQIEFMERPIHFIPKIGVSGNNAVGGPFVSY